MFSSSCILYSLFPTLNMKYRVWPLPKSVVDVSAIVCTHWLYRGSIPLFLLGRSNYRIADYECGICLVKLALLSMCSLVSAGPLSAILGFVPTILWCALLSLCITCNTSLVHSFFGIAFETILVPHMLFRMRLKRSLVWAPVVEFTCFMFRPSMDLCPSADWNVPSWSV